MATRSIIGKRLPDGNYRFIYCHWSGYPDGVGAILKKYWTDEKKIDQLLDLGDISILGKELGQKVDFNQAFISGNPDWTLAFGRDGGDKGTEARIVRGPKIPWHYADKRWAEYMYIWDPKEKQWEMYDVIDRKRIDDVDAHPSQEESMMEQKKDEDEGTAIERVVELYEKYGSQTIPREEVALVKNVIKDERGTLLSKIKSLTEKMIDKKRLIADLKQEVAKLQAEVGNLDEQRKQLILDIIAGYESVIAGLQEGERISINISNGVDRVYATVVAMLEKEVIPPDRAELLEQAVEIMKKRHPKLMKEFEEVVNQLSVSPELVATNVRLAIKAVFPEVKGVRSLKPEAKEFLKDSGLLSLIEQSGFWTSLWNNIKNGWNKVVGYIKDMLSRIFKLGKESADFANDCDAIARQLAG